MADKYLDYAGTKHLVENIKKYVSQDAKVTEALRSDTAVQAMQDDQAQNIASTYIKGFEQNGTSVTITKGDGTATTISYPAASSTQDGLLSAEDKAKLDTIEANANAYTLPTASETVKGGIKLGENLSINTSGVVSSKDTITTVTTTGVGNAVTDITADNGALTVTKGASYLTAGANAVSASKLETARTIAITGSVTGSATFDGSGDVSISTSTNHTHNYAGSSSAGGVANQAAAVKSYSTGNAIYMDWSNQVSNKVGLKVDSTNMGGILTTTNYSGTVAAASHTHNYAGSSSAGGSANSAVKLASARLITVSVGSKSGSAYFDGTGNVSISIANPCDQCGYCSYSCDSDGDSCDTSDGTSE